MDVTWREALERRSDLWYMATESMVLTLLPMWATRTLWRAAATDASSGATSSATTLAHLTPSEMVAVPSKWETRMLRIRGGAKLMVANTT